MYSNACKIVEMPAAKSSSIVEASTCQGQKARVPIFHAIQACRAILCYVVVNFLRLKDRAEQQKPIAQTSDYIADLLLTGLSTSKYRSIANFIPKTIAE